MVSSGGFFALGSTVMSGSVLDCDSLTLGFELKKIKKNRGSIAMSASFWARLRFLGGGGLSFWTLSGVVIVAAAAALGSTAMSGV